MATLRLIRGRIKVVRNSQKITKAMKLVSAAKLRRAQDAVLRARPYAQLLDELLASLAKARAEAELPPHPLMEVREPKRVEVVLLTSDRGLCGGFNSNIARKRGIQTRKDYVGFFGKLRFPMAREVADDIITEYEDKHLDAVYLLYN